MRSTKFSRMLRMGWQMKFETLPWLTEDDVVLDMDEIVVEDDEFVDTDESDDDKDESDVGWMDDKQWE